MTVENLIIIGSGPAGMAAAIYAGRANLSPVVLTGAMVGGQPAITNEIENFPGFPEGITGAELVERVHRQAERFGARMVYDEAIEVNLRVHPFWVKAYGAEYYAKAVIVASGASPRKLGVPGEVELTGHGVSYCGTCDGFFFRGKEVVVVGGGDSALEEALFLTRYVTRVRIIHRRDQLRASYILQERARRNEKIEFIWNSVVTEIHGPQEVTAVTLRNVVTGEVSRLPTDGVFIFVGHIPNSEIFRGQLDMDENGYIITDKRTRTNIPGVFAAGEVADPIFRQNVTSAGEGARAAIEATRWLAELEAGLPASVEDRALPR
jgi:thioredoxin reductase (NADPH)